MSMNMNDIVTVDSPFCSVALCVTVFKSCLYNNNLAYDCNCNQYRSQEMQGSG